MHRNWLMLGIRLTPVACLLLLGCDGTIHGGLVDVAYSYSGAVCQPADGALSAALLYDYTGVAAGAGTASRDIEVTCPLLLLSDPNLKVRATRVNQIRLIYIDNNSPVALSCKPWLTRLNGQVKWADPATLKMDTGSLNWMLPFGTDLEPEFQDLGVKCTIAGPNQPGQGVVAIKVTLTYQIPG
jgi:hypothetical protein